MADHWPTWDELRAKDKAAGRIDEAKVAEHRERILDAQRAYRLAEVRKSLGLTQTDVAAVMHVSQRRVSAVEHGDLTRTSLGTVATYVAALGGRVEIVASFGDERIVIGLLILYHFTWRESAVRILHAERNDPALRMFAVGEGCGDYSRCAGSLRSCQRSRQHPTNEEPRDAAA